MTSPDLLSIPVNPCPPGGEGTVIRNGGAELRAARWLTQGAKGTVVLAHGRTEFIEKYYEVIGELIARGFAVFTFDWRGQGMATRELAEWQRGHIENFDHFLADLDLIFASDFFAAMPGPRYVLAHSMGGNIMLRHLHANPGFASRAVFSAPMLRIGTGIASQAVHVISYTASALGRAEAEPFISRPTSPVEEVFETNPVTSHRGRFERTKATIAANPRLGIRGLSWQWIKAALDSVALTWTDDFVADLKVPILLIGAGREKLVDPLACKNYAALAPTCETVTIEGAMHEILMERDPFRRQFWALYDEFLDRT